MSGRRMIGKAIGADFDFEGAEGPVLHVELPPGTDVSAGDVVIDYLRRTDAKYDIALRPDDQGDLDDVVVMRPHMFRMERMDGDAWWLACYMDEACEDEVVFWMRRDGKAVVAAVTGVPRGDNYRYEDGSMGPEAP